MDPPPRHLALAVISRVKVMANLNSAERRLPQDGRIQRTVQGKQIDLRVSTLPTSFGESVVLRVLDRSSVNLELEGLGAGRPGPMQNEHRRALHIEQRPVADAQRRLKRKPALVSASGQHRRRQGMDLLGRERPGLERPEAAANPQHRCSAGGEPHLAAPVVEHHLEQLLNLLHVGGTAGRDRHFPRASKPGNSHTERDRGRWETPPSRQCSIVPGNQAAEQLPGSPRSSPMASVLPTESRQRDVRGEKNFGGRTGP